MGIFDYVFDLYAAMTVQEAYAEEPQKDEGKGGCKQWKGGERRGAYQLRREQVSSRRRVR